MWHPTEGNLWTRLYCPYRHLYSIRLGPQSHLYNVDGWRERQAKGNLRIGVGDTRGLWDYRPPQKPTCSMAFYWHSVYNP